LWWGFQGKPKNQRFENSTQTPWKKNRKKKPGKKETGSPKKTNAKPKQPPQVEPEMGGNPKPPIPTSQDTRPHQSKQKRRGGWCSKNPKNPKVGVNKKPGTKGGHLGPKEKRVEGGWKFEREREGRPGCGGPVFLKEKPFLVSWCPVGFVVGEGGRRPTH